MSNAEIVSAEFYPTLISKPARARAMALLKSSTTLAKANRVIALKTAELRGAVLALIDELSAAVAEKNWPAVFTAMHEIRGLAGTAGLSTTGRIANGFCHYLDAMNGLGLAPDESVAALHLGAVTRSARTEDDAARHGDAVAQQLSALVERKLAEIKIAQAGRN